MNQYSDLIPAHLYVEYKGASEERKQEIVQWAFDTIRSVNTFPEEIVDLDTEIRSLRTLASLDVYKNYVDNVIKRNNAGINVCYKHYPNIWDVVKPGDGHDPISMRQAFYTDEDLLKVLKLNFTYDYDINGFRSWFRMIGVGYCNNFRPSAAKIIYDTNLEPGSRVYDYAAGYGGRLLGAWAANNVSEYVAVDPNTETWENASEFISFLEGYRNLDTAVIYKIGSEDFNLDNFPQYYNYFDIAFSSPPYFNVEVYSQEVTQSYNKYPEYNNWVKYFLRPTIHNCIDVLKPNGIYAINIFEDSKVFNIKKLVRFICHERGFVLYKEDRYEMAVRPGLGDRDRSIGKSEPVWYFKHKDYI